MTTSISKFLIRMPNWLGDAVMATPVLEDIRRKLPEAHITVLCHDAIGSLLKETPHIDEFILFSKDKRKSRSEKRRIFSLLKQKNFDIGLLLTRSFSSAWWLYQSNIKTRIGFSDHWRSWLLTHPIPLPKNEETQHLVLTYKALLAPLKIPLSNTAPRLYLKQEEVDHAKKVLQEHGVDTNHILIGINPSAAYGDAKCWPAEYFRELTYRLSHIPHIRTLYFGEPSTKEAIDKIVHGFDDRVINLAGKTSLRSLLALIAQCSCFITNDSGPMHIADSLQVPLLALFGSTNEVKTGPYSRHGIILHKHVACSPCYLRKCPTDFRCMKQLSVDEVFNAVEKLLSQNPCACLLKNPSKP